MSSAATSIESLFLTYVRHICANEDPSPCLSSPPLLTRDSAGCFSGARSQLLTLRTLATSHELLTKGRTASVRELYYMHASLMEDSREATAAIASAQSALGGVPRHALGLFAGARGLYAGLLTVGGASPGLRSCPIPSDSVCASAALGAAGARFILVVEKAAIFGRLVEDRVWARPGLQCALVTGCGQPDLATRAFLRQLVDAHPPGTPVLGLVDCNPFGLGVLLTYAHGSKATPEAAPYAVPELAWLGLRGGDLAAHALPRSVLQPLTPADDRRLAGLRADPHISACEALAGEVDWWAEEGAKTELEALMSRGVEYMADSYLPDKLGLHLQAGGGGGALDMQHIDALPLGGGVGEGGEEGEGVGVGAGGEAEAGVAEGGEESWWNWEGEAATPAAASPAAAAATIAAAPASSSHSAANEEDEFDF